MELVVKIQRLSPDVPLPTYSYPGDAGMDLCSRVEEYIYPGERKLIPTGIRLAIPPGYVGIIKDRSGVSWRKGLHTMAGVVDSGYRGEVKVLIFNTGKEGVRIEKGDRIAQLLVIPVCEVKWEESPLDETLRGEGGWGSSGR